MSVSCALLATSLHQWARRYIRLSQPARCSPEKRARMRAYFANGVDKMHIPWAVEGLPTLLHLSLFLFFGGLVIFLFNIDREVFTFVVLWICFFSMVYGLITLLPLIRPDSPYNTPLSIAAWFLYAIIPYATFKVLSSISFGSYGSIRARRRLRDRYRGQMLGGVEKMVEERASEESSEIDVGILGWTISALGDDDALEKFFEAIPGLFNSKLVKHLERYFPERLLITFRGALDRFMGRTLSSNSVTESVKSRRAIIYNDIIGMIPCPYYYMPDNLRSHFDQAPVSIERLQSMTRWFTHFSRNVSDTARARVTEDLPRIQKRDNRWVALASDMYGLSERDLQDNVALGGDNVLLSTLIDVSRRAIHSDEWGLVEALTRFDIRDTHPGLQHEFCKLWNEFVQEARNREHYMISIDILRSIRHLYIALHQGTDAAPTAFTASTNSYDSVFYQPLSYPSCSDPNHRPKSTSQIPVPSSRGSPYRTWLVDLPGASPHHFTSGGSTVSRQVREASIIITGPPSSPPSDTGDIPRASAATTPALLIHTSPPPTLPGAVAAALQVIPPASLAPTLSYPLDGTTQSDMVASCAEPDVSKVSASTPTPTLVPASKPHVLNKSSASFDAGAASDSNLLFHASSVVGFIPAPPPPSRVPPLPDAEVFSLLGTRHTRASLPCGARRATL